MDDQKAKYLQVFQENLVRVRKQLGLSQGEVGAKIDMKQTQYSKLENADLDPRMSTVDRVSQALSVPLHELLREENPQNLSDEHLLKRVLELEPSAQKPLLQVIEGYLRYYEQNRNISPNAAENLAVLQEIRKGQKDGFP